MKNDFFFLLVRVHIEGGGAKISSSAIAYGVCVFIRVENDKGVKISLVHARSRVAPLKPIKIPRLELLACSIGARLLCSIIKDHNLAATIYCWSD